MGNNDFSWDTLQSLVNNFLSNCCSEWDQPPVDMRPPGSVPVKVFLTLTFGACQFLLLFLSIPYPYIVSGIDYLTGLCN